MLITLGIIGVVAAMTMPTLIQNYKKQVYVNGLKKAVSVSQNMLKQMQADEDASGFAMIRLFSDGVCTRWASSSSYGKGNSCEDNYGNPSLFEQIIPKYLNVVKTCKNDECPKYTNGYINSSNGKFVQMTNVVTPLKSTFSDITTVNGFYTSDGMIYYIAPYSGWNNEAAIMFGVDVNGSKNPNVKGRDYFEFVIDSNGKLNPDNIENSAYSLTKIIVDNGWSMNY